MMDNVYWFHNIVPVRLQGQQKKTHWLIPNLNTNHPIMFLEHQHPWLYRGTEEAGNDCSSVKSTASELLLSDLYKTHTHARAQVRAHAHTHEAVISFERMVALHHSPTYFYFMACFNEHCCFKKVNSPGLVELWKPETRHTKLLIGFTL